MIKLVEIEKIYGNEATPGNKKNIFKYYLDNNLLIGEYEQTNWRYIVNKTNKYRFIIDPLKIKVARANLERKQLDFALVEDWI